MTIMETIRLIAERQPMAFVLGCLMALDIATGVAAALIEKRLSSKVSYTGMVRKSIVVMLIGMAAAMERVQPDIPLVKIACMFFIVTEGISILENAKRAKVPIPAVLGNALDSLRQNSQGQSIIPKDVHLEIREAKVDVKTQPPKQGE